MSRKRFSFKMLAGSILAGAAYGIAGEAAYSYLKQRVSPTLVTALYFTGMYLFIGIVVYLVGRMGHAKADGQVNKKQWAAALLLTVLLSALFAYVYSWIGTGGRRQEFACKMQKQIDKLNWIVESLSKMVKLEQNIDGFEAAGLPVGQTILEAVDMIYEKLEQKDIELITEPFEDRLLYHNRKWTGEVFVNLLENAVKYTQKGGCIHIRVCPYDLYTEIQIADNGRGIKQEELTDIFKRFYRSPEVENMEGSGIGLYLSNLILEKEKGYMMVKSEYGKGSCFSVFLRNWKNEKAYKIS